MEGEDLGALLLDIFVDGLLDELLGQLLQGALLHFGHHDFHHFASDEFPLGALGVAGGLHLLAGPPGEPNSEESQHEAVGGLALDEALDDRVPLLDELAEFVLGHVHAVEVGVAVEVLDFFNLQFDLPPGLTLGFGLQISQIYFKHSSPQGVN